METMKRRILFASNNRGKYDELAEDFKDVGLDLVYYADAGLPKLELPEDYEILSENAKEKAAAAAKSTGYYTLGDDSGIFITQLDYFPGVHSRRWTGAESDDLGRNEKIIALLDGEEDRSAYLISRFSLADPDGNELYKTVVKNEFTIADAVKGDYGFGYDRILIPSTLSVMMSSLSDERKFEIVANKETIGEMTQDEKNAINNRGRIAREIKEYFDKNEEGKSDL